MNITPPNPMYDLMLQDKLVRKHLDSRASEWKALSGWRRILKRIQIHFWARRQANSEMKKMPRKSSRTF